MAAFSDEAAGQELTPQTIFFTGGTGNNGKCITSYLLSRGHTLKCLVRNPESQRAKDLAAAGCILVQGDTTKNQEEWMGEVADCDSLIWSSVVWGDFGADFDSIRMAIETLRAAAVAAGKHPSSRKLLITSGVLGYEQLADPQMPIAEYEPRHQSVPAVKAYAKKEGLVLQSDICGCSIALGFTYSHRRQTSGLFPFVFHAFDRAAKTVSFKGEKHVGVSHVHLDDVADLYAKIIEARPVVVKGQKFNCCNDANVSNGEVADALAAHWSCTLIQSETAQWALAGKTVYMSNAKAKRVLGFDPQHKSVLDELGAILDAAYGDDQELKITFH